MKDLGWTNAGGETYAEIERIRRNCIDILKHNPQDVDPDRYYGQHTIQCVACGYVYHEDSGD